MVKTTEACKLKREIKVYQSKLDKETSAGASWQTKYTLCHSDCTEMDRNFAACRATWTAARTFECKIGKLTSSRTVLRRRFVAWKTNMCFARLQQKDNDNHSLRVKMHASSLHQSGEIQKLKLVNISIQNDVFTKNMEICRSAILIGYANGECLWSQPLRPGGMWLWRICGQKTRRRF